MDKSFSFAERSLAYRSVVSCQRSFTLDIKHTQSTGVSSIPCLGERRDCCTAHRTTTSRHAAGKPYYCAPKPPMVQRTLHNRLTRRRDSGEKDPLPQMFFVYCRIFPEALLGNGFDETVKYCSDEDTSMVIVQATSQLDGCREQ